MKRLLFPAILWLVCAAFQMVQSIQPTLIWAMLASLFFLSLCLYLTAEKAWPLCLAYQLASLFWPPLMAYLPVSVYLLTLYTLRAEQKRVLACTWPLLILTFLPSLGPIVTCAILCLLAHLLAYCAHSLESSRQRFYAFQDDAAEKARILEQKNQLLQEKQQYQVQLATLTERNRIAREIHDNVGHLLTRSLFQISALEVTTPQLKEPLTLVKTTLTDAMTSIRASVHDLRDQALDLPLEMRRLTDAFTFCPVTLRCETGPVAPAIHHAFTAIVKEALSNIARHSSATQASISVLEHPAFYQLIIEDNGAPISNAPRAQNAAGSSGMGLANMRERIEELHGVFHLDQSQGFRLFISVPKDISQKENV